MSLPDTSGPGVTAIHDAHAFEGFDMHGAYECILCESKASVLDVDFFCDKHWLWCDVCGTGIFKGINWTGCPKCLATHFTQENLA